MDIAHAPTARDRVRAELVEEIKAIGRRHLAQHGAPALSLRAIAREAGMVSSAVYRYFPSRNELITALIIDAYDSIGTAVEQADAKRRRPDVNGRWLAICRAVRGWALANPNEWALLFGSPVPGYAAPIDTVDPAARAPLVLLRLVADGVAAGEIIEDRTATMSRAVRSDFAALRASMRPSAPDSVLARALAAWAQLFGSVSFELFGHLHNVITDYDGYFEMQMRAAGAVLAGRG
jgi:AcrR family transcriptional regulator